MKAHNLMKTVLAWVTSAVVAHAASIVVNDASFETNDGGDLASGGWSNNLSPDWEERDGLANGNSFEEFIPSFSSDGTDHIGMNNGYYIWQDTGVALQPNTIYTLTIGAGRRTSGQTSAGNSSVYALLAGTTNLGAASYANTAAVIADSALTLASASFNAGSLSDLTFVDAPDLVFTTGATVPAENVVILLGDNSDGARSHFDNIRLDATPIPEVSTSLFGLLGALFLFRRRR
jgi:opacity protein-like surface antigen